MLINYITSDTFRLFNVTSLSISLSLIGTWITIILHEAFSVDSSGGVTSKSGDNQIEIMSNLIGIYDTYNIFSAINAIIIFWRIMQFFSFSVKLSAFSEILSSSKSDIFYFLLMFIVILFGYAVTGYAIFGQ